MLKNISLLPNLIINFQITPRREIENISKTAGSYSKNTRAIVRRVFTAHIIPGFLSNDIEPN